jgi:cytochrome c oxidase subunit 2
MSAALAFAARWGSLAALAAPSVAQAVPNPEEKVVSAVHRGSFWFPEVGTAVAERTDSLFDIILWISIFFMVLITGMMGFFVWRYRRRPGVAAERTATHQTSLELLWTIIPSIICVFIFYFGVANYLDIRTPPADANEVQVTGQKWVWQFTYPNGLVSSDLHVPVGEPTRLLMRSEDVIHSMFIPAFRAKVDVVPGKYSKMWFTPNSEGVHQIFCAEYCGQGHSSMLSQIHVHSTEGYARWLADEEEKSLNKSPVALGGDLYKARGCAQCHSVDGTRGIGPSFKGLWGRDEHLEGGATVHVDENYLHESIIEPMAKIVAGYAPVMPTFKGKLKDREIAGLIEYIKTLK